MHLAHELVQVPDEAGEHLFHAGVGAVVKGGDDDVEQGLLRGCAAHGVSLVSGHILDDHRDALAHADAHRREAVAAARAL